MLHMKRFILSSRRFGRARTTFICVIVASFGGLLVSVEMAPHAYATVPTGWVTVVTPNSNNTENNFLGATTCISANDCWAAVAATPINSSPGVGATFMEHGNGATWTLVASPSGSLPQNFLLSITCVNSSYCWAVGGDGDQLGHSKAIMEHWNGSSWSLVPPADSGVPAYTLTGVSCVSISDCWAVGSQTGTPFFGSTAPLPGPSLVEHWDGSSWSIVTSPNVAGDQGSQLFAVTCLSHSNCWTSGGGE